MRNNNDDFILHEPTEEELRWRQRGYLDCLRALAQDGPPDPKYVEYLCTKTNQPFVSLTYLEDLRRKLGGQTPG